MAKVNTRTNTAKKWTLVALIAFLVVSLIAGTYARYSTSRSVNGSVPTAVWAISMKQGQTELTANQDVAFTVQSNEYVVSGKIAPDVTATATLTIDLTGTEVAVDIGATVDAAAIASTWGASYDKLTLTATLDGQSYTYSASEVNYVTVPLVNDTAFTASNGKKDLVLTITWANDDNNNVDDTSTGVAHPTLNIPVTLTARQHISA